MFNVQCSMVNLPTGVALAETLYIAHTFIERTIAKLSHAGLNATGQFAVKLRKYSRQSLERSHGIAIEARISP